MTYEICGLKVDTDHKEVMEYAVDEAYYRYCGRIPLQELYEFGLRTIIILNSQLQIKYMTEDDLADYLLRQMDEELECYAVNYLYNHGYRVDFSSLNYYSSKVLALLLSIQLTEKGIYDSVETERQSLREEESISVEYRAWLWLSKEEAVKYINEECHFDHARLWWLKRVEGIPDKQIVEILEIDGGYDLEREAIKIDYRLEDLETLEFVRERMIRTFKEAKLPIKVLSRKLITYIKHIIVDPQEGEVTMSGCFSLTEFIDPDLRRSSRISEYEISKEELKNVFVAAVAGQDIFDIAESYDLKPFEVILYLRLAEIVFDKFRLLPEPEMEWQD